MTDKLQETIDRMAQIEYEMAQALEQYALLIKERWGEDPPPDDGWQDLGRYGDGTAKIA